jgi:uncharacterized protein
MSRPVPCVLEPFRPAAGWANPHAQTVLANLARSRQGVRFRRRRLATPDGDFVDLDFASVPALPLPEGTPLILALHGLEGSARRGYICELYRQLARCGLRAVGLNFRSCSGELNRRPRLYNAGATADVAFVLDWLARRYPQVPLGAVGFSLGANVLLKYLGEAGAGGRVSAAVAVSPPFDLAASARIFETGVGALYARHFLRSLQRKARGLAPIIAPYADLPRALAARTLREFDDAVTAPLHGFRDAADYYARSSSVPFLPHVRVPTLLVRALDDPFFGQDIPWDVVRANPWLVTAVTSHGGHVGFVAGAPPGRLRFWAERQTARFLAVQLAQP